MNGTPMESQSKAIVEDEPRSYLDFEPYCSWHREEESDTLAVHLHGFQREQMKIELSKRILKIEGQRPLAGDNMWARFCKQVELPNACNERAIRAKLSAGILAVTMPKKIGFQHGQEDEISEANIKNNNDQETQIGVIRDLAPWRVAGKVAAVVIVLAVSGAFVHVLCKQRSYSPEK